MEVSHELEGNEGRLADLIIMVRDTIRRRWKTMALIAVGIFVAGVALVSMMTPQYVATARVQIDPSRNPLAKNDQRQDQTLSPEAIETEVSVVSSLDVARKVATKLKLENDPEFNKAILEKSGPALTAEERLLATANALLMKLSVGREKLTYIMGIEFKSKDSIKAARIANAFAETYLETKVSSKAGTAKSQVEWFRQRLDMLGREVREADAKVAQYRASAGIVGSGPGVAGGAGATLADQRIGPLSSQIATAESTSAAAQAQLAAARSQAARGGLDSVSAVRASPVVSELRRQRAELLRTIGEIQVRYGDKHPESVRVRGQLETVDRQIKEEGERVLGSLAADAAAADAQVSSLHRSMGSLEGEREQNTRAAVLADSLERESTAKRAEYDRLSQMLLESTQAAQNSIAQAEIVERAEPPSRATSPNKPLLFALALLVGLAAGAGTIAAQEMMVSGMRSAAEIEQHLGLALLAAIPRVSGKDAAPHDLLIEKPTSLFAESLRIARASILGVRSDKPSRIIAITSALPSEGKTTTAVSFARTLAIGKDKTLLLECDVRRAAVRPMLGLAHGEEPGIVEVLHGEASPADAIRPSGIDNLDQMLVSKPFYSSEDLFGGERMRTLLESLSQHYDRIVLDLPPLVGLADGRFLSVLADATVVAIKWDETPTNAVVAAMQFLRTDGANTIGAVFTMVDTQAEAMGGLYYSKKYSSYYQNQ